MPSTHQTPSARPPETWWKADPFVLPHYYHADPFIWGPTQLDDLGMLVALIKEVRPHTLAEIGFYRGDGTRALLAAADPDAHCYSFDPNPAPGAKMALARLASRLNSTDAARGTLPTWHFRKLDARQLLPEHVDGRTLDFVFFDAGHRYATNVDIFRALRPLLSDGAIIAIHDTGYYSKAFIDASLAASSNRSRHTFRYGRFWSAEQAAAYWHAGELRQTTDGHEYYVHQDLQEERRFIEYLRESTDFHMLHLHSFRYLRNGLTILQRDMRERIKDGHVW